jgi:hypothetical protein
MWRGVHRGRDTQAAKIPRRIGENNTAEAAAQAETNCSKDGTHLQDDCNKAAAPRC